MKINNDIAKLILHLEYIIGDSCYNPNSYDGWTDEEGCSFRYPVHFSFNDTEEGDNKYRSNIANMYDRLEAIPDSIDSMYYAFGSNHLYIGQGLRDVLKHLEKRYGIDFNELEDKYQKKLVEEEK